MTDLRNAAQRLLGAVCAALPYAPYRAEFDVVADTADALRAALAQQAEPVQTTHSAECWRWHHACAVAEIERLKERAK